MFDYCLCPHCGKMIMLDGSVAGGYCLYCGGTVFYEKARALLLEQLKTAVSDIPEDYDDTDDFDEEDDFYDGYEMEYLEGESFEEPAEPPEEKECRELCAQGERLLGSLDFGAAFAMFTNALEKRPESFEAHCGVMTAGILLLSDVENWEKRLCAVTDRIRSQNELNMAQKALKYALDILKRFFSKGGRYVSPSLTIGFFEKVAACFPALKQSSAEIAAHCLNIEHAPLTDAARLDHETTRCRIGTRPTESDKNLHRGAIFVLKNHNDPRVKESLCRALFVYDRAGWLRGKDEARIEDAAALCEQALFGGGSGLPPEDAKIAVTTAYDFLMMGSLEQNSTQNEKLLFLSGIYSIEQMRRFERYFGDRVFFWRLYGKIFLAQKHSSVISPEYKRIKAKTEELSD